MGRIANIYFSTTLNNRLQVPGLYSDNGQVSNYYLNKTYTYAPGQNNGNIMSITNNKDTSRTQTFTYDALNRITAGWTTANTGTYSWGENYDIDAWGNLEMSPMAGKAQGGNFQCAGDGQNHATCLGYDAAGNVTANGGATYTYDQENRIASPAGWPRRSSVVRQVRVPIFIVRYWRKPGMAGDEPIRAHPR